MNKNLLFLILILGFGLVSTSCGDDDETGGPTNPPTEPLLPKQSLAEVDQTLSRYTVNGSTETFDRDYEVDANIVSYRENKGLHERMFNRFTGLIPDSRRNFVKQYTPFHGGNEIAGYVYPLNAQRSEWNFGLDVLTMELEETNLANAGPGDNVSIPASATVLHEYGHLLSLFQDQLDLNNSNCTNFDSIFGCMKDGTKLQRFFEMFWEVDYADFLQVKEQFGDAAGDEWYGRDETRFVTPYAATQPEEDFAESFYIFFFRQLPTGSTVEDQKVLFFYSFPDLVLLRTNVRDYLRNQVLGSPPPPGTTRAEDLSFLSGLPEHGRKCALGSGR